MSSNRDNVKTEDGFPSKIIEKYSHSSHSTLLVNYTDALLANIAVQTANLIQQNKATQKELEHLQRETTLFLLDVLSNPENKNVFQILPFSQL